MFLLSLTAAFVLKYQEKTNSVVISVINDDEDRTGTRGGSWPYQGLRIVGSIFDALYLRVHTFRFTLLDECCKGPIADAWSGCQVPTVQFRFDFHVRCCSVMCSETKTARREARPGRASLKPMA